MNKKNVTIKEIVSKIKIEKRDTEAGKIQREAFRIRWGKKPEDL